MKKVAWTVLFFAGNSFAHSIYISTNNLSQQHAFGDNSVTFDAPPLNAQLSFDVNDQWQVWFDYASDKQSAMLDERLNAHSDISSYGLGTGFSYDNWFFSAYYANWEETFIVDNPRQTVFNQRRELPGYGVSASYGWEFGDYALSAYMSLNHNKSDSVEDLTRPDEAPQKLVERRSNNMMTASLDASRYWQIDNSSIIVGGELGWAHVFSQDQQLTDSRQVRPGRNNPQQRNHLSALLFSDESYGFYQVYALWGISEQWAVDVSYGGDFSVSDNQQSWSAGISYRF